MLEFYWGCLIGGALLAVVTLLLGDLLGHGGHDIPHADGHDFGHEMLAFLRPSVIVSAITAFGGAGILLTKYSGLASGVVLTLAILVAAVVAVLIYFLYVKPMMRSENSIGFSMRELVGKMGEVITTIPEKGYGEVLLNVGASRTNQIAASADDVPIRSGTTVVVVEVDSDTLYVTPIHNLEE